MSLFLKKGVTSGKLVKNKASFKLSDATKAEKPKVRTSNALACLAPVGTIACR